MEGAGALHGIDVDMADCSDLVPALGPDDRHVQLTGRQAAHIGRHRVQP